MNTTTNTTAETNTRGIVAGFAIGHRTASVIDNAGKPIGFVVVGGHGRFLSYLGDDYRCVLGASEDVAELAENINVGHAAKVYAPAVKLIVEKHCGIEMSYAGVWNKLDRVALVHTMAEGFADLVDAARRHGDYVPSLSGKRVELALLADCYDAAQAVLGDARRAYRN